MNITTTFYEIDYEHDNSTCPHCFPLLQPISFIFPRANKDSLTYLIAIEEKKTTTGPKPKDINAKGLRQQRSLAYQSKTLSTNLLCTEIQSVTPWATAC
jgi:hypothetical protein